MDYYGTDYGQFMAECFSLAVEDYKKVSKSKVPITKLYAWFEKRAKQRIAMRTK